MADTKHSDKKRIRNRAMSTDEKRLRRWHRFAARISVCSDSGCWNWDKATKNGYGESMVDGQRALAHRAVWIFLRGEIPAGLDLDHLCRNRACVNPDHLEPVTRRVNLRRGFEARGCINGHHYRPEDFSEVRRKNGVIERRCKVCHRERNKRAKAAKKAR